MADKIAIYDSSISREISIESLADVFRNNNVTHIYYKLLSPNDNSKNQPYLAGHITDLAFLPTGKVTESSTSSKKSGTKKRKIKYTIDLEYSWLSPEGQIYPAPDAKLIYYPQYPEVRLSGYVTKCGFDMGGWMDPTKKGREPGRVLFFGVTKSEKILAYLATPDSRIAKEILDYPSVVVSGVIKLLNTKGREKDASAKEVLIQELRRIHLLNWIKSKRLDRDGALMDYKAQNGGGYTLEAELGIIPNGYSDPDFVGWEIKQFSVTRCDLINSKALTLMTPEPDGGFYVGQGVDAFMHKYGYQNPKIIDRLDFTGRHFSGSVCARSGLTLTVEGYDVERNEIIDADGCIALLDQNGDAASVWSFSKLMEHWKKKHAKAAYIPSMSRMESDKNKYYHYCNNIRLFEGANFPDLLRAFSMAHVYYDPGIKLENASTCPKNKRRSQFRIKSSQLRHLYENQTDVDLLEN